MDRVSGKFVLRIDPQLHREIRRCAVAGELSLNEFCARALKKVVMGGLAPSQPFSEQLLALRRWLQDALVGVVVFGSWARGDMHSASDIDFLIVLDHRQLITRSIYTDWETHVASASTLGIEPQFVYLPDETRGPSGFWAEIATDGIILFEQDFKVSRYLMRVREFIATGRLVRRKVHGQHFWIHQSEVA